MSVRDEVEYLNSEFSKAVSNQDADALGEFYMRDAKFLTPGAPMIEGKDAIREWFQVMLDAGVRSVDLESIAIESAGELVIDVGRYRMNVVPPGADPVTDEGKYIVVFKREANGDLRIAYDTFNSDIAPSS